MDSMKYHAHEALDWMKDIAIGMHEGGRSMGANSGFFSRSSPSSESGFGGGGGFSRSHTNPVSHQNQNQNQNHGTGGTSGSGSDTGFVRPKIQKGAGTSKRSSINPISHQAQSRLEDRESLSPPPPLAPPVKATPVPKPLEVESAGSTEGEREFMLGDDEGEEGDDVGMAAPHRANPVASTISGTKDVEGTNAAGMRGRELGGGDATRL